MQCSIPSPVRLPYINLPADQQPCRAAVPLPARRYQQRVLLLAAPQIQVHAMRPQEA
eukprot:CAMPEP_0206257490 /NCGR_PEP_ID=MMETSP0047_2-20121206/25370_1 /ASSEMBLY_ACC=CAM_ASM_000192 /TAXON_ID=195065 /ORGANISM="Chroomonas mesostigmatica_cf, Strain CCMP1168" /LENGTH=56 /DNA_ID=CAMNT_0053684083 /DNA_START=184 /DNA_END=350 /DNA_ORIENTATION=-